MINNDKTTRAWSQEEQRWNQPTVARYVSDYDDAMGGVPTWPADARTEVYPTVRVSRPRRKSRFLAGALQMLLPGFGSWYMGDLRTRNNLWRWWGIGVGLTLSILGAHLGIPILAGVHVWALISGVAMWAGVWE